MKSILPVLLLAFGPGWSYLAQAQGTHDSSTQSSVQKMVVYPIRNPDKLAASITWYSSFFGRQPARVELAAPHPYAIYLIDEVEVRLDTDPKFVQLKEPVFYWVLPTATDVETKFNALNASRTNRFERNLFQRVRSIEEARPGRTLSRSAAGAVTEVSEFIVLDPEGNQVGVINNPVYPPTADE